TGKPLFRYDLKAAGHVVELPAVDRKAPLPRFSLTADGARAYARLGRQGIGPRTEGDGDDASFLVCLDLGEAASGKRERWHVKPPAEEGQRAVFEGAPLVRD